MSIPGDGPTAELAQWVARSPHLRRRRALNLARDALQDITACMVAGSSDEAAVSVARSARDWGTGRCSVVSRAPGFSAPAAALANATAAHALDYDDNFHPLAGHATAVLAPAVLAVGESLDASGLDVLDAYVAGLEVQAVIGAGVNLVHYERGWHSTSTVGTFGAAAACARLQRLDAAGVAAALSLAFSMAGGSKLQFGTMAKPLHAGLAAQHGVMAAALAAGGLRGAAEPLAGPWGFRDLFAGNCSPGFAGGPIGRPLALEKYGLKAKLHPCCASTHCAVDAMIQIRQEHGLAADDVARVEVLVNRVSFDNLRHNDPGTELEARFSMQWCIALALLQGRLGLADFTPAALARPELRAWLPRIGMRQTEAGREHPTADNGREPALTTVVLHDGRRLQRFVQHPKGSLQAPLSAAQQEAKFRDCAPGCNSLRTLLVDLEAQASIRPFMALLRKARPLRARTAPPQERTTSTSTSISISGRARPLTTASV